MIKTSHKLFKKLDTLKSRLDSHRPLSKSQVDLLRAIYQAEEAYATNAIEGSTLTLKETQLYLAKGITAKGKPLRDHLEVSGQIAALEFIHQLAGSKRKRNLTESDVRQIHTLLFDVAWKADPIHANCVGVYKKENNHVLTAAGKVHYYADAGDVSSLMSNLVKFYNTRFSKFHPIEAAAIIHHRFTAIHPFSDGNGRVARILSNLYLMQKSWPPITVSPIERDEYYRVLEQADANNLKPLVNFFSHQMQASLERIIKILEKTYRSNIAKHNIFHLRSKFGMTQVQLAKKSGIAQARISRIEQNKETPGYKTLNKIAKALRVNITDL